MISLIIGGSGSGKSAFAEEHLLSLSDNQRIYIATMKPVDEECMARIAKHRKMRFGKQFTTLECYTHLEQVELPFDRQDVLLECLSNLLANEQYAKDGRGERAVEAILSGISRLCGLAQNLCIVSNDIFSDGVSYEKETDAYMARLGELNRQAAAMADEVIRVVAGCPVYYKKY